MGYKQSFRIHVSKSVKTNGNKSIIEGKRSSWFTFGIILTVVNLILFMVLIHYLMMFHFLEDLNSVGQTHFKNFFSIAATEAIVATSVAPAVSTSTPTLNPTQHLLPTTSTPTTLAVHEIASLPVSTTLRVNEEKPVIQTTGNLLKSLTDISHKDFPIYYINLASDVTRKEYTEKQLRNLEYRNFQRVQAWSVDDVRSRVVSRVTSIPNMLKENLGEFGCIASHLYAIYTATNDYEPFSIHGKSGNLRQEKPKIPFALIIEDDIKFEMPVDWIAMIKQIPFDFTILQLSNSNSELAFSMWNDYVEMGINTRADPKFNGSFEDVKARLQWFERSWSSSLWSTQAYIVNLEKVRPIIKDIVDYSSDPMKTLITFYPPPTVGCVQNLPNSCLLPYRIVADIYLYSLFTPTFTSRIPMFNGAGVNDHIDEESSIQENNKVNAHVQAFTQINQIIEQIKNFQSFHLPTYFLDYKP